MLEGLFPSNRGKYHHNKKKENIITWIVAILVVAGIYGWSFLSGRLSGKVSASEPQSQEPYEASVAVSSVESTSVETSVTETTTVSLEENTLSYEGAISLCSSFNLDNTYEPIIINNNIPTFEDSELYENSFEYYSPLDSLGRAVYSFACIGQDLMPIEDRAEEINVDPSGWHSVPADNVENGWLYNRCHLIAYCLTAEGDNECNFVTGTRNMNVNGMLPYEEAVAEVLDDNPGIHIMYRVTPIFIGDNLVCNGVLMEAYSVEDNGQLVCFCIFCPNTQPEWSIHYDTGFADPEVA